MAYDLYDGAFGVALFLAGLEKVTGGAGHRDLVLDVLRPLRKSLHDMDADGKKNIASVLGIGGTKGLGSIIYCLVRNRPVPGHPGALRGRPAPRVGNHRERVEADRKLDIMSGTSGAILGLLALHRVTGDQAVLEAAVTCGNHLLMSRIAVGSGHRAWATLNGRVLTGFSHLRGRHRVRPPEALRAGEDAIAA